MRIFAFVLGAALLSAGGMPAAAESRGERTARLRSELRTADRLFADGRLQEAEQRYGDILGQAEILGRPNLILARVTDALGDLHREGDRLDQAAQAYRQSAVMWEELLGPDQPRLATTLHNLGVTYLGQGRVDSAEPILRRALSIWEASFGKQSSQALNTRRAIEQCVRPPRVGSPESDNSRHPPGT